MQFNLLDPEPVYVPPALPEQIGGIVGFDIETDDPDLDKMGPGWFPGGRGKILGFSLAWQGGKNYWSLRHAGGNVEDPDKYEAWLKHQLEKNADCTWVAHNLAYELGWLNVKPLGTCHDTWLMASILDDTRRSNSLDNLLRDKLGMRKDEGMLHIGASRLGVKKHDVKKHLAKLPAGYVVDYGIQDSHGCRELFLELSKEIAEENLEIAYERERRLCHVLVDMRRSGVRVDVDKAEQERDSLKKQEAELVAEIKRYTGLRVDVWSANSLNTAFKEQGIELPTTEKGEPSCTKEWLTASDSKLAKDVLKVRRINKNRTTFIEGVILTHVVNGRIFPEINQTRTEDDTGGTISGRFSYSKPNLQFLPARNGESAKSVRGCFIPDNEDEEWVSADYSQQEPRLTVHYAEAMKCKGAKEFADRYRTDPKTDMHDLAAELTGLIRKDAKILNLAIIYGQGNATTCKKLGLPTTWEEFEGRRGKITREVPGPEGQKIIDTYHENLPFVSELDREVKGTVRNRGYIITLGRRKMRVMKEANGKPWESEIRKFLNKLIQGGAADQTKQAIIDCYDQGILPKVQVHDELCFSLPKGTSERVRPIMVNALPLNVPSLVDIAVGSNWGEVT